MLVGGFGESLYLLQLIQASFGSEVLIQQPANAWTAVCRGAVHRGATGGGQIVCNHISKYSYGVKYSEDWEYGMHFDEDRVFDMRLQNFQASNRVKWYLRKVCYTSIFWYTLRSNLDSMRM
jgi:hypothetical protein